MKFRFEIGDHGCQIETSCTMPEMCASISTLVHELYKNFTDETVKNMFKDLLQQTFADGVPFSEPDELTKKIKEQKAKRKAPPAEFCDSIKEFLEGLNNEAE